MKKSIFVGILLAVFVFYGTVWAGTRKEKDNIKYTGDIEFAGHTTITSGVTNSGIQRNTGQTWHDGAVGITFGTYTVGGASNYVLAENAPSLIEISGSTMTTTIQLPAITADMHGMTRTFRRKSSLIASQAHRQIYLIPYATGVSGATDELRLPSGNAGNMYTIYANNNFVTLRAEYANSGLTCFWVVDDESDFVKQDADTYVGNHSGVSIVSGVSIYTATGINASGKLDAAYNSINPGDIFTWKFWGTAAGTASVKSAYIISGAPKENSGQTMFTLAGIYKEHTGDFRGEITMYVVSDAVQKWDGYLAMSSATPFINYTDTTWDLSGVTYFGLYVGTITVPDTITVERAELWRGNR